jgi:RNA recognition motif-containing protein
VSIFVGNLPFRAEQDDVAELFAPFGDVVNCSLPLERDTGRKRGFAFVEMADDVAETKAIDALQGAELMGRPLRINKAEPRGAGGGGGQRRGGYGGGGYGNPGGGGGYGRSTGGAASGARGWEDRSYGSGAPAPSDGFDAGRTRRRRSGGGDTSGGDYYGGAEG